MKHEYTDTQLQAAIDGACNEAAQIAIGFLNTLDLDSQSEVWAEETPARIDLIKSALAALPEPEPSLSQLRPLSEAGAVPEGCFRVYGYYHYNWSIGKELLTPDTHFADIRLPEPADKPAPYPLVTKPILPPEWTPAVGDVVTLKSGGPKMTIRAFDRDDPMEAWCHWFKDEKSCAETFPTVCLQPA